MKWICIFMKAIEYAMIGDVGIRKLQSERRNERYPPSSARGTDQNLRCAFRPLRIFHQDKQDRADAENRAQPQRI